MRNLALAETSVRSFGDLNSGSITSTVLDTDNGTLWATSERINGDADVVVDVWKIDAIGLDDQTSSPATLVSSLTTPKNHSVPDATPQVVSIFPLLDERQFVLVSRGGDIATLPMDDPTPEFEVVGSVEDGILSAEWSPDSSLLTLVTGENKLVLMTSTFDPLHESPLHTSDFGEDTPINLGWGSKQTQFHGSLGKAAAQSSSPSSTPNQTQTQTQTQTHSLPGIGSSPDDDNLPRISWRADGAYFVVSSLTPAPSPTSSPENRLRRRVLRVYNRDGVLQSTSEPVAGMEHNVAWRPAGAGGLIVSTQRFAPQHAGQGGEEGKVEGLASGREGRHDVVFLERNGLRHGEFGIREWERLGGAEGVKGLNVNANGGKGMRWGYRVREVSWSADGGVLGIWVEGGEGDVFQLWTIGNYNWYLKHEIAAPPPPPSANSAPSPTSPKGRFTSVRWHPERPLELILTTADQIIYHSYTLTTCASPLAPAHDTGTVAVIDGTNILLTPFRSMNVPPPMAGFTFDLSARPSSSLASKGRMETSRTPAHVCLVPGLKEFSGTGTGTNAGVGMGERTSEILSVLWGGGEIEMWELGTRVGPGRGKVARPELVWRGSVGAGEATGEEGENVEWREIVAVRRHDGMGWRVGVLGYDMTVGKDVLKVLEVALNASGNDEEVKAEETEEKKLSLDGSGWRFVQIAEGAAGVLAMHNKKGEVFDLRSEPEALALNFVADLGTQCDQVERTSSTTSSSSTPATTAYVGLSRSGTLICAINSTKDSNRVLSQNANSFTIVSGLVIYTTTSHESWYVPISSLTGASAAETILTAGAVSSAGGGAGGTGKEVVGTEKRRVERGSRIVVAVPSTMSLVLQMPRGNLETINPRAMVMRVVRDDVDAGNYRKAFLACRKHRVDLNVLVDHDPAKFRERLGSFLDQVEEVDYVNLFLTSLGSGTQPPEIIASLCDAIRVELERRDLKKYVNSILTAYVVRRPPAHEAGLGVLLRLKGEDPTLVEEAVKYIIFLVDANTLFDIALGMYDFELVLMIAQHAQKDPREYLPFLRELRALEKYYQRFRIDDHLKRYEGALRNLKLAGSDHFDEAMEYLEKHRLYELGLELWNGTEEYSTVLTMYGEYLFERREFKQAAIVFVEATESAKAMIAYEKALQWRELMDLAEREHTPQEDIEAMAYRIAEDLTSKKRYAEASLALLDYANDVREAVIALVQGNEFSEARRVATRHSRPELLEEVIHPGTLESRAQISEEIGEMREQLRKQVVRVRELRVRKVEEPDAYYGNEDTELHNVDVMTDVSQFTAFTRYTAAPSNVSKTTSKRSSRSKRKMERKVGSGRKGTVDEEEYLLKSITKLVTKFGTVQDDASNLIPHLLQLTPEHRAEARSLQSELSAFETELRGTIDEIWTKPQSAAAEGGMEGSGEEPVDSWAKRMEEREKDKEKAIRDVVRPEVKVGEEWKVKLVEVGFKGADH